MIHLVVNEVRKLVFKRSFVVYLILIFAMTGIAGLTLKYSSETNSNVYYIDKNGESVEKHIKKGVPIFTYAEDGSPVTSIEKATTLSRDRYLLLKSSGKESYPNELEYAKNELDYYEVYLRRGITPITTNNGGESAGSFFAKFGGILSVVNMLVVIVASVSVASEFSGGTIKLLLIRPYKRSQILLSKLLVCLLFAGFVTLFTLISAAIIGAILFPVQSFMLPASAAQGGVSALKSALMLAGTNYLLLILYVNVALMISAVFRSQALAVGIGMLMLFSSSMINAVLSMLIPKFEPLKWVVFNLLSINDLGNGLSIPGDLSLWQAGVGLLAYSAVIYFIAYYIFKKRDVALS